MNVQSAFDTAFSQIVRTPADFPANARIRVRTFHWEHGEMDFVATAVGPSSASHLRIRMDDGLIFAVPAGDCDLVEEAA